MLPAAVPQKNQQPRGPLVGDAGSEKAAGVGSHCVSEGALGWLDMATALHCSQVEQGCLEPALRTSCHCRQPAPLEKATLGSRWPWCPGFTGTFLATTFKFQEITMTWRGRSKYFSSSTI